MASNVKVSSLSRSSSTSYLEMVKKEDIYDDPTVPPISTTMPAKKKAKKGSQTVTQMSFEAIIAPDPVGLQHTLILGTFPSEKSQDYRESLVLNKTNQLLKKAKASALLSLPEDKREEISQAVNLHVDAEIFKRGGEGQMNYGNFKNPFWNIAGIALGFRRELTTYEEKKVALTSSGYCLWDVCKSVEKKAGSSLDNDIKTSEPNDILGLLTAYPTIKRIVFPRTSALYFIEHFKQHLKVDPAAPNPPPPFSFHISDDDAGAEARSIFIKKANKNVLSCPRSALASPTPSPSRVIELVLVPSTSPANCRKGATPPYKEKKWLVGCYGWSALGPKSDYKCACCGEVGSHYTVDCDIYTDAATKKEWTENRKRLNKEQGKDPAKIKELWDCENWYI
ncbi:hypothetical protein TrRE_jg9672 [Triparma retinervis]|uniref:Uncharacterized protein n=1 Tax=Triparma retinervis TaxID=2557542 RepID=A0A9W7CN16_9STRA|nr:hypothetical protein TrRE_jg9672 [Triparma retinervis]